MPYRAISEESFLFIRVDSCPQGPAITCPADTNVMDAARLMREHDSTTILVANEGSPVGVFSIRDLRDAIAASGGNIEGCTVGKHIGHALFTIRRDDYVFEAIFKMARHNVYRLGVVDDGGTVVGVVTSSDLLKIQTSTPLYLYREIEDAHSIDQLKEIGGRLLDIVSFALRANTDIKNVVQLISRFNDAIVLRLIRLLATREGIRLPAGAAYLVMGSEGRGEQTLRTDQDNAIVYRDDLPSDKLREVERFAFRIVAALEEIGVPRCPGNIMASSPDWRHSMSDWKKLVHEWVTVPTPENVLNFGMFQDLRPLHGDQELGEELREHIQVTLQKNAYFYPNMADHVVRFPSPFTLLGRIRVEPGGEHKGKVDLKKAGIFAITTGASILCLEAGMIGGNTWEKLERLGKRGIFSSGDLESIVNGFSHLTHVRLKLQMKELPANCNPTNHIDPEAMTDREREQFRQALKGINTFLWIFKDHYNINFTAL